MTSQLPSGRNCCAITNIEKGRWVVVENDTARSYLDDTDANAPVVAIALEDAAIGDVITVEIYPPKQE